MKFQALCFQRMSAANLKVKLNTVPVKAPAGDLPKQFGPIKGLTNVFCLFDLILYIPSIIFHLNRDRSSWVEPVLS